MKLYVTSKNTGPSYGRDPITMRYLGTSLNDAIDAVGEFIRYEQETPGHWEFTYPDIYSALPGGMEREWVKYYTADGWWYSIVSIDIPTPEKVESDLSDQPEAKTEVQRRTDRAIKRLIAIAYTKTEVLRLKSLGRSNLEITYLLNLSESSVRKILKEEL